MTDSRHSAGADSAGESRSSPVWKLIGSIAAPTTLLTALMLYFGRLHATGLAEYFGIQYSVLDLTAQDYLVRSADGLIVPLLVAALAALLAIWTHRLLTRVISGRARRAVLRGLIPVVAVVGLTLMALAVIDLLGGGVFGGFREGRGLSLVVGIVFVAYALWLARLRSAERKRMSAAPESGESDRDPVRDSVAGLTIPEWVALFVVVSIGLFWAVGTYAHGVGAGRGQQLQALLPSMPSVALYSQRSLSLEAPGVTARKCQDPEAAYRFRYDGLRLVMQSGNQYLLLPAQWTPASGAAILIPRTDSIRLEFSTSNTWRRDTC